MTVVVSCLKFLADMEVFLRPRRPRKSVKAVRESGEGKPEARGSYGILQLVQNDSRDTLGEAAGLIRSSEERLKTDRERNIQGGAAILAELQGATKPEDLDEWYDAVAEYGDGPLYADQESTQNDAWFKTKIPTSGNYAVYGWWPTDRGYNNRAVYWIYTADDRWVSSTVN